MRVKLAQSATMEFEDNFGWSIPSIGRWERLFADVAAELAEAEKLELAAEVTDRTRRENAQLRLTDRLRAAQTAVSGQIRDVGPDWLLLSAVGELETLISLAKVSTIIGLPSLSATPGTEGVVAARLDLRFALRRLARDRAHIAATLNNGAVITGTIDRVGADFCEIAEHPAGEPRRAYSVLAVHAVPLEALVMLNGVPSRG